MLDKALLPGPCLAGTFFLFTVSGCLYASFLALCLGGIFLLLAVSDSSQTALTESCLAGTFFLFAASDYLQTSTITCVWLDIHLSRV